MAGVHGYTGVGVPATAGFQWDFNGLLLGDGTPYNIIQVEGLDAMPAIQQADVDRGRDTGQFQSVYYVGGREITITLEVQDTSAAAFRTDMDNLGLAFAPVPTVEMPMYYTLPGMAQASRLVWVRPIDRPNVIDQNYLFNKAKVQLRVWATDPRSYDSNLQSAIATLPAGNGGATWPWTWPVSWGSSSGSGLVNVTNSGNFETRPVIVINGPVDNPTITNNTTGLSLSFLISLINTDTLTIDFLNKTVILNGTASRRNTMSSAPNWWNLPPGTSVFAYRANTVQVGSTATIYWQSAWM